MRKWEKMKYLVDWFYRETQNRAWKLSIRVYSVDYHLIKLYSSICSAQIPYEMKKDLCCTDEPNPNPPIWFWDT